MVERYSWATVGMLGNPKKTVQLGFRGALGRKISDDKKSMYKLYVTDIKQVKNKTKFVEYFSAKGILLDESLRAYSMTPIGDGTQVYAHLIFKQKCVSCKKDVTYADGMFFCENCSVLKNQYI